VSAIEIGTVEFILIWDSEKAKEYTNKYEITLGQFENRTEIIKVLDVIDRAFRNIERGTSEWFRIHSILSKKGFLRGE